VVRLIVSMLIRILRVSDQLPYYEKNKKRFPRVTHILKIIRNPDFESFKEAVSKDRYNNTMDHARDRGITFHKLVEKYAEKKITPAFLRGLEAGQPELYKPFVTFISWADAHLLKFLAIEETVYHDKQGYAGTPDFIAMIKGKKNPCLFDCKFTAKLSPMAALQTAAYVEAANIDRKLKINSREILRMDKHGKLRRHPQKNQSLDYARFLYCLDLYKYVGGEKLK